MRQYDVENRIYSERADLFDPNIFITFMFNIDGPCNVHDVEKAVIKAFYSNAVTMSKIALEDNGTAFYEKMNQTGCSVQIVDEQSDLEIIREENEKKQMNLQSGEMMRVFIKEGEQKKVLINAHHLVGDGKSIVYFIEQIMCALNGEKLEYREYHLVTEETFKKHAKLPYLSKLYAKSLNRKWNRNRQVHGWEDIKLLFETYWKERESVVYTEKFSPREVEILHEKAKQCNASLNSYISTAFLRADVLLSTVGMAADARLDGNRCMSNQATGITVNYKYNRNLSFEKNVKCFHRKMKRKLENPMLKYFILLFMPSLEPTLVDSMLMSANGLCDNSVSKRLAKVMAYSTEKTNHIGISNLTRLDIENRYGEYTLSELYFIPPVISYARQTVGIATMQDGMTISYHGMSTVKEASNDFFSMAIKNLKEN